MAQANPDNFDPAIGKAICDRMAEGASVRSICRDAEMPSKTTVMDWLVLAHRDDASDDLKEFAARYALATEWRAEALAEEALEIADDGSADYKLAGRDGVEIVIDHEHVGRSKLRINQRNHMAEKLAPKKWGPAMMLKHADPEGAPLTAPLINVSFKPSDGSADS